MNYRSICTVAAICAVLIPWATAFGATQVVKGSVAASPEGSASVKVRVGGKVIEVERARDTVITRGEIGKPSRAVALREFVAGDQFVAIIEDGKTISMKATYAARKPAKPVGPLRISSITFSAPVPLKPGDVITVDLSGTPKAKAAFSVRGFIPVVSMKEMSPGSYHGTVRAPVGKTIRNAPLVGYLGMGDTHAAPMQASRLITLLPESEPVPKPTVPPLRFAEPAKLPVLKPISPPVAPPQPAPAPVVVPVEAPKVVVKPTPVVKPAIVLSSPVDGGTVKRLIVVKGTADPSSDVKVTITYSNSLTGLLKLGGEVASQNVSVGKDGQFRMGPIALDGPLATDGLKFTIKAYYPERADHGTAQVSVTGKRD